MATYDELVRERMAGTVLPTYERLIQPENVPTGEQLVPGFTPMQEQAQQMMQGGIESYLPWITQAGQAAGSAMEATGPGAISAYMNPYIQQVADTTMTDLNRQFGAQQAQQQQRQIQSGGFAGSASRGAIMDAELARAQGDATAKAMSGLYAGGFDQATQAAQRAAESQMGIAGIYGDIGRTAQQSMFGDINQMMSMGEQQRQIQAGRTMADWRSPYFGIGQYTEALKGVPQSGNIYQSPNPILTGMQYGMGASNMLGS